MRAQIKNQLCIATAIVSKKQIKDYVNSLPSVLDCNPVSTGQNKVTVYIKPKSPEDRNFGFITYLLGIYGSMAVQYEARVADSFSCDIILHDPGNIIEAVKNAAVSKIEDIYSYSRLKFTANISVTDIATSLLS